MKHDYTILSTENKAYGKGLVTVSSGSSFVVLKLASSEILAARHVLYVHVHRKTKRCYVGQAKKTCQARWQQGNGYKPEHQPKLRAAIDKYGWDAFDSFILAFISDPSARDAAEVAAIRAAGGHRSQHTFNLAPGGRVTVDRSEPIDGYNLDTKEWKTFPSAAYAAEILGIGSSNNIRRVVAGSLKSSKNWWFRERGSKAVPPAQWGLGSGLQKKKSVTAVKLKDRSERVFESISAAARVLGIHSSNITSAVKTAHGAVRAGYWFKYTDSSIAMPSLVGRAAGALKNGKPVRATHVESGEIREFISGRAAAKELGFSEKNVPAALKGRVKTLKGWKLSYA